MAIKGVNAEVDFLFGDDEGRRDDEVAYPGLLGHAVGHHLCGNLIDDRRLASHLVAHGIEGPLRRAVLDEFDGEEEPDATDVADGWMLLLQSFELFANVGL